MVELDHWAIMVSMFNENTEVDDNGSILATCPRLRVETASTQTGPFKVFRRANTLNIKGKREVTGAFSAGASPGTCHFSPLTLYLAKIFTAGFRKNCLFYRVHYSSHSTSHYLIRKSTA
eukprot:g72296.t1